jgi:monothiol glutaredoxin
MEIDGALKQRIDDLVTGNRIVLIMKGDRRMPQCGFSARVVDILDGLVDEYATADVLKDPALRDGIKVYSDWPTLPQLYVDGEFLGGCDIITEMATSGELHEALGVALTPAATPSIRLTPAAVAALTDALAQVPPEAGVLRFRITPDFQYELKLGARTFGDVEVTVDGCSLALDRATASRAEGTVIDHVAGRLGGGFKISNPAEPPSVRELAPEELKAMMDGGEAFRLFDVRSEGERRIASIGGELLTRELQAEIDGLDRTTTIVFYCRSGARSRQAAEHFRGIGFVDVRNLTGGINAWSSRVDPSVTAY